MGFIALDPTTIYTLVIIGNAVILGLFFAYFKRDTRDPLDFFFMAGKLAQAVAWILIQQRDHIPRVISFQVGSSLLSIGIMLELLAIAAIIRPVSNRVLWAFGTPLALCILNLWLPFGRTYEPLVGAVSIFYALMYLTAGWIMLSSTRSRSGLERWLGFLMLAGGLAFVFRSAYYLAYPAHAFFPFAIMRSINGYLFFGMMVVGSIGLILLKKEHVDRTRERALSDVQLALQQVKTLSGLIPICAACHKVRNDKGYWEDLGEYLRQNSEADVTSDICPDCKQALNPDFASKNTTGA
jgi:hypothetical protein